MIRRALVAAGAALLLALPAAAQPRLELWLPASGGPRVTSPGPLEVSVVRRAGALLEPVGPLQLEASAGELSQVSSDDPFVARALFLPPPGFEGEVRLKVRADGAKAVEERLLLGQGERPRVVLRLLPAVLVKGRDEVVQVEVRTLGPDGEPAGEVLPRLFASVGSLSAPVRRGPGVFAATYSPSEAPYPEVAVLLALLPRPQEGPGHAAVGRAVLPQPAAIELPGETRPGVEMQVQIAGERFGPVQADGQGRFLVPVVVPPGVGGATGLSKDRIGNVRRTAIDLRLPPTQRVALALSSSVLVADGAQSALVVVSSLKPSGEPLARARPTLRASRGRLSPLVEVEPGLHLAWYTAPATAGDDELVAALPGDATSRATAAVRLAPKAPRRLELSLEPRLVTTPGPPLPFEARLVNGEGEAVAAVVRARADHGRVEAGEQLAYLPPGSSLPGEDRLVVRGFARAEGRAVRAALTPEGVVLAVDALGRPVPGAAARVKGQALFADEEGRLPIAPAPGLLELFVERVPASLRVGRGADGALHGAPAARGPIQAMVPLALVPPLPVLVDAEGERAGRDLQVRWEVTGGGEGDAVRIYVDGALAGEGRGSSGGASVPAGAGAFITVTHVPSGIGASFQAGGAT